MIARAFRLANKLGTASSQDKPAFFVPDPHFGM
jgi:hypothetical protein